MIKVIGMFKKNPELSDEEFRDYYENKHIPLFYDYMRKPGVDRWVRRYLKPIAPPITGEVVDAGFDVVVEVWCDEQFYQSFFVDPMPAAFRAQIVADEVKLFDRDQMFMYVVDEHDTDLAAL